VSEILPHLVGMTRYAKIRYKLFLYITFCKILSTKYIHMYICPREFSKEISPSLHSISPRDCSTAAHDDLLSSCILHARSSSSLNVTTVGFCILLTLYLLKHLINNIPGFKTWLSTQAILLVH